MPSSSAASFPVAATPTACSPSRFHSDPNSATAADTEDGMSDPLDVDRNLDHCVQNIKGASEAMAHDRHDAAMRLGAAEMMLASASQVVHKHAAALTQAQTRPSADPARGS